MSRHSACNASMWGQTWWVGRKFREFDWACDFHFQLLESQSLILSFFENEGKISVESSLFCFQIIMTGICNNICIYNFIICLYSFFFFKREEISSECGKYMSSLNTCINVICAGCFWFPAESCNFRSSGDAWVIFNHHFPSCYSVLFLILCNGE